MVLISNSRQFFRKQYGRGIGHYYTDIYGNGVFLNSMKNLGKLFFRGSKLLYNKVKPKAITFAKETLEQIKPKIQKVVSDASTKIISDVINKPSNIKESSKDMVKDVIKNTKTIVDETIPSIKERGKKSFHELINGGSIKRKQALSSKSKSILNTLLK